MLISLFLDLIMPTSNLLTQPCQIRKTSKSTTRKPMLSKSTTRQTLTSKSLCHVQNLAFGLVPSKRYFAVFGTSDFYLKAPGSLYLKAFLHTYFSTLDINTTVSTWTAMGIISRVRATTQIVCLMC